MPGASPGVARGGFGEYRLGSCYTDSMLIGIRRETGAGDGSIGIRRSLNGLAANPRMARRNWYEQQIRSGHPDRDRGGTDRTRRRIRHLRRTRRAVHRRHARQG